MYTSRAYGTSFVVFLLLTFFSLDPTSASATVNQWARGANVTPTSAADFSSDSFKQSLRDLKATGANYVALVVPYYQSNIYSTDIQNGWNTPDDASLASAIDYAHSLGLSVAIKVHIENYSGDWRALINPSDRTTWFQKYGDKLVHLGQLGKAQNVEMLILGTELASMASSAINSTNTQNWLTMIGRVRAVYGGIVTYDANSTNNNDDSLSNEKKTVGFWSALDMAGLSVYYNLNTNDNSVASLEGQWDYWNKSDLMAFQNSIEKPLLFSEIGYRSVDNAHKAPWDSGMGGGYNPTEQANAYQAFFDYWNKYSYVNGVLLWDWSSNPNTGGSGDTGYTPQHKPALTTLTQWYSSAPAVTPQNTTYQASGSVTPSSGSVNSPVTITAKVGVTNGSLSNGIIDIEVYDTTSNKRVFQKFYENQSIQAGNTQSLDTQWSPASTGQYRVTIGVFTGGWAQNLLWLDSAATISVGTNTPPPPPPPQPTPTPTPTPTPAPVPTNVQTNIWWPSDGSHITGVQPFKANIDNLDVSQYTMYWQVDGGTLNEMGNSSDGYTHKESLVDVTNWHWKNQGPYTLTFVSKNSGGTLISQKTVQIFVQ